MDINSIVSAEALADEGYVKISKAAEQLDVDVDTLLGLAAQGKLQLLASITRNQAISIVWPDKALPPELLGLDGNFFSSLTAAAKVTVSREQAGVLETTGSLTFNYFLMPDLVTDFLKRNKLKELTTANISPVRLGFSSTQWSLKDRLAAEINNIEEHNLPKDIFYSLLKARYAHEEVQDQKEEGKAAKFNIPEEFYDDLSQIPWSLYSINSSSIDYSITTSELFISNAEVNRVAAQSGTDKPEKPSGHIERYARDREVILAAALHAAFELFYDRQKDKTEQQKEWKRQITLCLYPLNDQSNKRTHLWKLNNKGGGWLLGESSLGNCLDAAIKEGKTLQQGGTKAKK